MHAIDANVLARALVRDPGNEDQCERASLWLAAQREVFVPQVVQVELVWLLGRGFGLARGDIEQVLHALASHPAVRLQAADAFEAALKHLGKGGDFADGILLAESARVGAQLATFDRTLSKIPGTLLVGPDPT